jgi:hypothetical protein
MPAAELSQYRLLEERVLAAMRDGLDDAGFNALALAIHAFQRHWNTPYSRFCATRPEPRDWQEIPPVPQSVFKRHRLATFPPEVTRTLFRTSGTTGETRGEHHFRDTRLYDAAIVSMWNRLQLPLDAFPVFLVPKPENAPHSSLSHMAGVLGAQHGHWLIEEGGTIDMEGLTAAMRDVSGSERPLALFGTALAFVHLFEQLEGRRFDRRRGSFAVETGGYKGTGRDIPKAALYTRFGEVFDIPPSHVFNEYGMTELSSQFYARGVGTPHQGPPWARAVIIDPETGLEVRGGEAGIVRIVDLANVGSVIAIETQDIAIRRGPAFELIGRDPAALPRGCSRTADESLSGA